MLLYYLIATLAVLLYMHGFFPIPPRKSPDFTLQDKKPPAKFRRAVLIVIDALRLDFVTPELMPFVSKTLHENGCFVQLKVEAPTVTLPRIKALTTGNVPQFIDIVINLASPEILEDSFVHRAYNQGKKIVFYGDDIWLKLFPSYFIRSEGTSSFFVRDFYEVDSNVTRNVEAELKRNDWDIMILHYLGLDHIGHVYGPKSHLIPSKLQEMETVIEDIYNSLTSLNESFFILITGDHGMRDSGGHGGSTYPETNVPLIPLGISCKNDSFTQTDIPINFNTLLGIETPSTSIGLLKRSLIESTFTLEEHLNALKGNLELLKTKTDYKLCVDEEEEANLLHDLFITRGDDINLGKKAAILYEDCANQINAKLLKSSIEQNLLSLVLSCVTILTILIKICVNFVTISKFDYLEEILMVITLILQFLNFDSYLSLILVIISIVLLIKNLAMINLRNFRLNVFIILYFIHPLTFLSSSFLEEEHQFWYFVTGNLLLALFLIEKEVEWIFLFVILRFLRGLNQIGDQYASSPDLTDWLVKPDNYIILRAIFIASLIAIFIFICKIEGGARILYADALILEFIIIFRVLLKENVMIGKFIWFAIIARFFCYNVYKKRNLLSLWILIITLLIKPENSVLIPCCIYSSMIIKRKFQDNYEISILSHLWLGSLFFFLHGHDNSLASIDISCGYIGLRRYNPILVFPQVLFHTFAFPVLSTLLLLNNDDKSVDRIKYFVCNLALRLYVIVVVFIVTFVHRNHLFIWSVFAPKIFIEGGHFGGLLMQVVAYYVSRFRVK